MKEMSFVQLPNFTSETLQIEIPRSTARFVIVYDETIRSWKLAEREDLSDIFLNEADLRKNFININTIHDDILGLAVQRAIPECNTPYVLTLDHNQPAFLYRVNDFYRMLFEKLHVIFHTMLDVVDEGISIVNDKGTVISWNSAAENIYGLSNTETIGHQLSSFFHTNDLWCLRALQSYEAVGLQHEPLPAKFIVINAKPVYENGKIIGAISADADITSLVQANKKWMELSNRMKELENVQEEDPFANIITHSDKMFHIIETANHIASSDATVLLRGETGTGKELFALSIHQASHRKNKPFVAVNCAAIPEALFESEFFGYEEGAFTGARKGGTIGKIEMATGGTLFLDEIGDLPMDMQAKILRLLQEHTFYRVGSSKLRKVDVRIIAATNQPLENMIIEGRFRTDLFYRLNIIDITLPPLRERKEDIPDLVYAFLKEFSDTYKKPIRGMDSGMIDTLLQYDFPGNIRELRNIIERMIALSINGEITAENLPDYLKLKPSNTVTNVPQIPVLSLSGHQPHSSESSRLFEAIAMFNGNKSKAAKYLGISRATLYNRMRRL